MEVHLWLERMSTRMIDMHKKILDDREANLKGQENATTYVEWVYVWPPHCIYDQASWFFYYHFKERQIEGSEFLSNIILVYGFRRLSLIMEVS